MLTRHVQYDGVTPVEVIQQQSGAFSATFDVKKYDDAAVMAAISADRQQDTLINDLKGVDIAIDCSGSAPGRSLAIKSTRRWGLLLLLLLLFLY